MIHANPLQGEMDMTHRFITMGEIIPPLVIFIDSVERIWMLGLNTSPSICPRNIVQSVFIHSMNKKINL